MTDHFSVLGVPRRPGLEATELKARYFRLAAELHPDAGGGDGEKFAALQESVKVLGDPALRLRHLVQLTHPEYQAQRKSPMGGEMFLLVGGVIQEARSLAGKKEAARSPLAKAVLAGENALVLGRVRDVLGCVRKEREAALGELAELDASWPEATAEEMDQLAARLAFVSRWEKQLAEWEFRLAQQ